MFTILNHQNVALDLAKKKKKKNAAQNIRVILNEK